MIVGGAGEHVGSTGEIGLGIDGLERYEGPPDPSAEHQRPGPRQSVSHSQARLKVQPIRIENPARHAVDPSERQPALEVWHTRNRDRERRIEVDIANLLVEALHAGSLLL